MEEKSPGKELRRDKTGYAYLRKKCLKRRDLEKQKKVPNEKVQKRESGRRSSERVRVKNKRKRENIKEKENERA